MSKLAAFLQKVKSSEGYRQAASAGAQAARNADYSGVASKVKVAAAFGSVAVIGGVSAYGIAKASKEAISGTFLEPYDLAGTRTTGVEGASPNDTMLFAPTLKNTARQGLSPGQFADNGDLALSLSKLRRG